MDLRHLESDELNVECQVRNIDPLGEHAVEKLSAVMTEESAGNLVKPSLPHPLKTSSEISLCKRKLSLMEEERQKHEAGGDVGALEVLQSRANHLVCRLERLESYALENIAIPPLLKQARSMVERIAPSLIVNTTSNVTLEDDLVGWSASGTNIPPIGLARSTGVTPKKVTDFSGNGMATAWNADPSIIAAGRSSLPPLSQVPPRSAFQSFINSAAQVRANGLPSSLAAGNLEPNPVQGRIRPGLTHILSKWTVRFSGGVKDLAVDEFFFRVENLATADNVHADSLLLGLHCLLTGNASDFYWVQRRKNPDHTWPAFKRCMIAHFARQETDLEIRRVLMGRVQGVSEGFGDFSLAMECLAARLTRRMADEELVDILRQNMSPKLQTCMLMIDTPNTESLKTHCLKFERLWASQTEAMKDRRMTRRMAELGFDDAPQVAEVRGSSAGQMNVSGANLGYANEAGSNEFSVAAMNRARPSINRNEYMVCWNCDDLGHSFTDCSSPDRKVFCYGCGTKNAYKPSCVKCNPGNMKPGGIVQGQSRSTPNPFALTRNPNQSSK